MGNGSNDKLDAKDLRERLVQSALAWQHAFSNAPAITSALSEYDAAMRLGMTPDEYSASMQGVTAVQEGYDFRFKGKRYQVKANRPSGKPGSRVTLVAKARNYKWDYLVWVLYNCQYEVQEVWLWERSKYEELFHAKKRLSPKDYRQGTQLP